ncbi:cob(I)yrinic acid a,c-diamide adenosyltransferase [Paraglaciecola hydrolytica]|uniref:Corrinoid adenosyltransferase n=1 Tax=Paraglaciecola hydrolytica TaxID=1799789 RepID=A0A136A6B8_9ALTE|nr:cob(I)yrinic acid a,c-diamide adenosyltransferase [Paraglaciecola hydrolytica]KXI30773.1 cobalamin adenosyltransferase [Paraglaciecola hydrolytica]
MKIYTKGGDQGQTQIYADKVLRLSKSDAVLDCYGTLDELNAHLGLLHSYINLQTNSSAARPLQTIQQALFQIGFAISANSKLSQTDVEQLEIEIDNMQAILAPQTTFILPGGCIAAAQAHVCRTVTRRAERHLVALMQEHTVPGVCLQYINRLSDYLFVLARSLNHQTGVNDIKV